MRWGDGGAKGLTEVKVGLGGVGFRVEAKAVRMAI